MESFSNSQFDSQSDKVLQQFAFLGPRNRDKTSLNGNVQLAIRFGYFSPDEMDTLNMEFRDYRASFLNQLPTFDPKETGAIDHFWAAMAKVPSILDTEVHRFAILSTFAQVLLILLILMLTQSASSV